jgi:hypothetical protein
VVLVLLVQVLPMAAMVATQLLALLQPQQAAVVVPRLQIMV